jgi:outer membrane protein OmpA-like peptidoglycan-associated protein
VADMLSAPDALTEGFGSDYPLVYIGEHGSDMNRRVEVWVRLRK